MEVTLDELLKGKATRIKNNEYFPTEAYVTPFLERLSQLTDDFVYNVQLAPQISLTKDGDIDQDDVIYNRVWIQAILPDEYQFDNHKKVIGMVYGLDVRKPVYKLYTGGLNMACTNLCVFNPDMLQVKEMMPEQALNYRHIPEMIEHVDNVCAYLRKLSETPFVCTEENINESLGRWVRNCLTNYFDTGFGKVKLATSTPVDAYKLLFTNEESPYYVNHNEAETTMFNVYNAFTQLLTDNIKRDVMNTCEKTLLLKDILEID